VLRRVLNRNAAGTRPSGNGARPQAGQEEAYRVLRSNLGVVLADMDHPAVMITSAQAGEGKTSTAINLAAAIASARHRLVLVDLDLRHPDLHRWLGAHNEFGVTDVLLDRRPLESCLQFIPVGAPNAQTPIGFYLLPTGPSVSNPTELLSTRRLAALLESLVSQSDLVLIDTAPVLPVADTLAVGRIVSGALLVVEMRKTPVGAVQRAKDALIRNQTRLLGVVMNKQQQRDADVGYYGYGYGYGDDGSEAEGF
jgi:capsular exopolysaccharide synthesis family protein